MTIPLTGSGGLFTRMGAVGQAVLGAEAWQQSNLPTFETNILDQYLTDIADVATLASDFQSAIQSLTGSKQTWAQYLTTTLQQMVQSDVDVPSTSTQVLLQELISQMQANSQSISQNTVSSSYSSPAGRGGALVVGLISPAGDPLQYVYNEQVQITCTADGQGGSQTPGPGTQSFVAQGGAPATSMLDPTWPMGSGATLSLSPINPDTNATNQNLLTNSNFEVGTGSPAVPASWTIVTGTAGTTVSQSTTAFRGNYSLAFIGNGSELTQISQSLGSQMQPSTVYCLTARVRVSSVPTAGVLQLAVGSTTLSIPLTGLAAGTWTFQSLVFASPALLPSNINTVTIGLTTALTSGVTVYIDDVGLVPMKQLGYGPYIAIQPGSEIYVIGDQFLLNMTNNYASKFGTFLWRVFGLDSLGLIVPNSASPTIPDSLI